ncbi:hypothetical protein K3N28_04615 [Glycomyces sp. TRM65418]|uniref:hypothetical protein n=1 Tax=Glycomyces sp. TRM65418 TaxID=2867006 RepID=UPI001CE4D82D|nr:hypothetical protein [Glycomyces sp. TRM65418]MCC3762349.1 hypothetical protein [Glycomyces sp. TRM65418]QZD56401.1 hypothetical protein K3N28_04580 [Glycomyces sp. TRM65418]
MTMPPPPPDRMHLQYRPVPPPPPGSPRPQTAGPGGAYGPLQRPMGGMAAGGAAEPQRPAARPRAVAIAAIALGLLAAVAAWQIWLYIEDILGYLEWARENGSRNPESYTLVGELFSGTFPQPGAWVAAYAVVLVCAVITIPALLKGAAFGRIFGLVWSIPAIVTGGYALYRSIDVYNELFAVTGMPLFSGPEPYGWYLAADTAFLTAALAVFVFTLVPGVRAWTPVKPSGPIPMMVPMGQPQVQQQYQQYQPPQQGGPPPRHGPAPQGGPGPQSGPYGGPQQGNQAPRQQPYGPY